MVDLALTSMALFIFSRLQQHSPAAAEASTNYHRLLRIVQEQISLLEISQLDDQTLDASLLAVYLMGRYEAAICRRGDLLRKDSPSFRHHDGAMAILRLWNDSSIRGPATFIMKQTRRGLIRSALLRNLPLPEWLLDGSRFGEHGIELDFDRIYVQIVDLHYKSRQIRRNSHLNNKDTKDLNNKAREIDDALQDWAARLPSSCACKQLRVEDSDIPLRSLHSTTVYNYRSPVYGSVWAHFLAARMLINSTRLSILGTTQSISTLDSSLEFEQQRLECSGKLATLAEDMVSTVPFCLEKFKVEGDCGSVIPKAEITTTTARRTKPYLASLIAWPLTIASSIKGIDEKQQSFFRAELARLGSILGGGVFEFAETTWLKL